MEGTSDCRSETKVFATHSTGSRQNLSIGLSPALSLSPSGWHEAGGERHVLVYWRAPELWNQNILYSTKHIPVLCPREKKLPPNDDPKQRQPESVLERKNLQNYERTKGNCYPALLSSASSTLSALVDHHFIKRDILGWHMTTVWKLDHSWFKASYDDYITHP